MMQKETMTLREGLNTLNILDKQIKETISGNTLIAVYSRDVVILSGLPINDWEEQARAKWQSLNDKINRRNALKNAILRANVMNSVRVPKFVSLDDVTKSDETEEISFAEAIARKAYYKDTLQGIVNAIKGHISDNNRVYEQLTERARQYVDNRLNQEFANVQNPSPKQKEEREAKLRKDNEIVYNDPCSLVKSMALAGDNIAFYLEKIDGELGKASAVTEITFEY